MNENAESSVPWPLVACLIILAANLLVLGLTIKLYTEFAKDRFQSSRRQIDGPGAAG